MKTRIRHLFGAALSLLVIFGLTHSAAAQTRIVFNTPVIVSGPPKHPTYTASQIYSMNLDGTGASQLTSGANPSVSPSWSQDQRYIAFFRNGLEVMEAVGEANGGQTFSVAADVASTGSDWSPDGTTICFPGYSTQGIWLVNVNAATREVGTPSLIREGRCAWPAWSPDGTKIAFEFDTGGGQFTKVVKVLDLVTGNEITFDVGPSFHPSWSPDGLRIAFHAPVSVTTTRGKKTTTNTYYQIFIANADGSGSAQVTNLEGNTMAPTWSPDGTGLAFSNSFSGTSSIYRMTLATGAMTLLFSGGQGPDWTP